LVEVLFDVCVVGGGPAGSATAISLAKLGHQVCLIERCEYPRSHVGESLSGGIWAIFDALGLEEPQAELFLVPGETSIRWSEPRIERLTPIGRAAGLLVDRGRFDSLLLEAARCDGVKVFQPGQILAVSHDGLGWQLHVVTKNNSESVTAKFLVDGAGRAGFLPRKRKRVSPRTLALCGSFPSER
jgi:flavin-dependent dehydrogenase